MRKKHSSLEIADKYSRLFALFQNHTKVMVRGSLKMHKSLRPNEWKRESSSHACIDLRTGFLFVHFVSNDILGLGFFVKVLNNYTTATSSFTGLCFSEDFAEASPFLLFHYDQL